jgi:hypothetical protein
MPPPDNKRVVSAARMAPLAETGRRNTGEYLRAGAAETVLNGAGLLRDVWDDFKSSDRYFKYKAMVLVSWLFLTVTSVGIACPTSGFQTNAFGARLVVAGDAATPIYMVKNDGTDPWQDVEVLVNGQYRSTAAQVDAQREITLSPVILYDASGARAPSNLQITEIVVQVADDKVVLLEGGQPH